MHTYCVENWEAYIISSVIDETSEDVSSSSFTPTTNMLLVSPGFGPFAL
jgi:hypothetical protein